MATVDIITKGRSKVPSIMKLMRKLTFHATHHFVIHAGHIAGVNNSIANSFSRHQMKKFRTLTPAVATERTPCLTESRIMFSIVKSTCYGIIP
ncbi:hypothetical protein KUTeg_001108 [Tegillarca granosa]|uniref:Uncharacterized protein n=1 Tax=Tegillarca granosa TaxID=220873 RepID=A0ABQ9FX25_TEGGR|nr:hypothetical protein KUTeg_001108 [Tegillarca granosa]